MNQKLILLLFTIGLLTSCAAAGPLILQPLLTPENVNDTSFAEIISNKFPITAPVHGNFDDGVRVLQRVDARKEARRVYSFQGPTFITLLGSRRPEGIDDKDFIERTKNDKKFHFVTLPGTDLERTEQSELYLDTAKHYALMFNREMSRICNFCGVKRSE